MPSLLSHFSSLVPLTLLILLLSPYSLLYKPSLMPCFLINFSCLYPASFLLFLLPFFVLLHNSLLSTPCSPLHFKYLFLLSSLPQISINISSFSLPLSLLLPLFPNCTYIFIHIFHSILLNNLLLLLYHFLLLIQKILYVLSHTHPLNMCCFYILVPSLQILPMLVSLHGTVLSLLLFLMKISICYLCLLLLCPLSITSFSITFSLFFFYFFFVAFYILISFFLNIFFFAQGFFTLRSFFIFCIIK